MSLIWGVIYVKQRIHTQPKKLITVRTYVPHAICSKRQRKKNICTRNQNGQYWTIDTWNERKTEQNWLAQFVWCEYDAAGNGYGFVRTHLTGTPE